MIDIEFHGFDWDQGNLEKCRKHGVPVQTIEWFFKVGDVYLAPDYKHSQIEDRYLAVGRDEDGRPLFVAFTLRRKNGKSLIRPISARYMHQKEIEKYEQESS